MKVKKLKAYLALLMVGSITTSVIGCGNNNDSKDVGKNENVKSNTASSGSKVSDKPIKLKVFAGLDQKAAMVVKNYNEQLNFQELEKRTNVSIEWQHPPVGQEQEQFNLMIASNDLPDMIYSGWLTIAGGPQKYIDDGIILTLNDLVNKNAPDFKKLMDSDKDIKKVCVTNEDKVWGFPLIFGGYKNGDYPLAWLGPQIRKDWLDKAGLKVPENMKDWYNVLKTFKEKDVDGDGNPNNQIPFTAVKVNNSNMGLQNFSAGYGVLYEFMLKGSKVTYGPLEPEFKEFVTEMAKWYKEGLIDPDFAANDTKNFDAKVSGGNAGALFTGAPRWGKYISENKDKPNYKLVGVSWPKTVSGKMYTTLAETKNIAAGAGMIVTKQSKHPVECVKWLNYQYSDEGATLMNWGVKDVTYVEENGKRRYSDAIMKDAATKSIEPELSKHTSVPLSGWCTLQDGKAKRQALTLPGQLDLYDLWGKASTDLILPFTFPSVEESAILAQKVNEINTYRDEMVTKFIMGAEPLSNYDKFVKNIKNMGIDEAINIKQKSYDEVMKK